MFILKFKITVLLVLSQPKKEHKNHVNPMVQAQTTISTYCFTLKNLFKIFDTIFDIIFDNKLKRVINTVVLCQVKRHN